MKLKLVIEYCDTIALEDPSAAYIGYFDDFPICVVGSSPEHVFEEVMTSIKIKIAHDSGLSHLILKGNDKKEQLTA